MGTQGSVKDNTPYTGSLQNTEPPPNTQDPCRTQSHLPIHRIPAEQSHLPIHRIPAEHRANSRYTGSLQNTEPPPDTQDPCRTQSHLPIQRIPAVHRALTLIQRHTLKHNTDMLQGHMYRFIAPMPPRLSTDDPARQPHPPWRVPHVPRSKRTRDRGRRLSVSQAEEDCKLSVSAVIY